MFKARRDKSNILKVFNLQLKDFLNFVSSIFPKSDDIITLKKIVETFCKFNPVKIMEVWHYYIATPYSDLIEKGDFNYFENKNYASDVKDLKGNAEYVLKSFNKLRSSISSLDNNKKMMAMKYTQILTKLANAYYS